MGRVRRLPALGVAALALAGCGSSEPPHAADGTRVAACRDGSCEIRVDGRTTFGVDDSAFGFPNVTVTVHDSAVTIRGTGPGTSMDNTLKGTGTRGQLNTLGIKVVWIDGDRVVLRFDPI